MKVGKVVAQNKPPNLLVMELISLSVNAVVPQKSARFKQQNFKQLI